MSSEPRPGSTARFTDKAARARSRSAFRSPATAADCGRLGALGNKTKAAALAAFALAGAGRLEAAAADRVLLGARVWTGDPARPRAEALAIRGRTILAVGSSGEIRRHVGPRTEVLDLRGRFVAPGFNDAHLHFLVLEEADLGGAADLADVQARIRSFAESHRERPWILGRGWVYSAFPGGLPDRRWLDEVAADRPAFLQSYDGHTGWANSRALEVAGITRATPDPPGGAIVRNADGEPTGVLKEAAQALVRAQVPQPSAAERYTALRQRLREAASYGLTSVQNASFQPAELPVYERALGEGAMSLRVYWALPFKKDLPAAELARYRDLRRRHAGPLLKFGAVKGFLDGVVESKTAALFEPYANGGGSGQLDWSDEDLFRTAAFYDRHGFQILLHAIGDRAIAQALDAYAYAARVNGTRGRRHRVEHIEVARPADLPRFRALGVIASTQALFATPDANTLGVYVPNLGPEREARAMAFRSLDEAGAVQAFGSDWPVYPMEPLRGIYVAATRRSPEGTPESPWTPAQRIPVEAALRHFTVDASYASFEERRKGTLAPGMLADLVVLSHDILALPPERLLEAKVLLTIMDGRDTYRAAELPRASGGSR
jgi:predicted amidohydrolase YtcJ